VLWSRAKAGAPHGKSPTLLVVAGRRNFGVAAVFMWDSGKEWKMRGVLLWALGIPIPIIILLYLFGVM
jgi:hypothetical protein